MANQSTHSGHKSGAQVVHRKRLDGECMSGRERGLSTVTVVTAALVAAGIAGTAAVAVAVASPSSGTTTQDNQQSSGTDTWSGGQLDSGGGQPHARTGGS